MPRSLPRWLRRPTGRAGATLASVGTVAVVLAASVGVGYSVTQPALGDGSAFLARGHTIVHVNGETGRSDAEAALQLATGAEEIQTVRLPDGRVAIVNKTTGTVTFLDASTLTPSGPPTPGPAGGPAGAPTAASKGTIEPIPTQSEGYLVDTAAGTVTLVPPPGRPAAEPVRVATTITAAVPAGDAAWILTAAGDVIEVHGGQTRRTVHLGDQAAGLTVADAHPVVVLANGEALAVDGEQPRGLGHLTVAGADLVTGSWRGAGRHVLAVDRHSGRLCVLDPRTGRVSTVDIPVKANAQLAAPVELGNWAYVPDYAAPGLWRVNLTTGRADTKALDVAGKPGRFTLEVTGGRVWANNQYDRRALIVDGEGHERYVDKGAAPDVGDAQGQGGGPGGGTNPTTGPEPDPGDQPTSGEPDPAAERVPVPTFPPGTSYQDACRQIERVRLRCRPVAAGNANGRPGEVLGTDPAGGTSVAVGSRVVVRYVAPLRTPAVTGLARTEACRLVTAAKLTCDARPAPTPATAPELLDRVSTQDPGAGAPVGRGDRVTIEYANTIALPPLTGQTQGEACARLATYRMTCTPVKGDPAVGAGRSPGAVYAQNPAPATVVAIGTRVTVTYYAGEATTGEYRGQDITAACATVRAAGFTCGPVEGGTAAGTGEAAGTVYGQNPPTGTVAAIGATITLTYRSPNNDLPSYVGVAADAACGDVRARGFQCNPVAGLHPSTNVVFAQDQGAGRYPLGSVVTVHYSPWALVSYWVYQKNDDDVWVLRPEGQIPAGYGRQGFRVGAGYAPGTGIPGASNIFGFFCTAGGGRCNGLDVNHFYTRATSYGDPLWQGPNHQAVFMSCTGAGTPIYRTWNAGSPRYYKITSNPGGAAGTELLGCVW